MGVPDRRRARHLEQALELARRIGRPYLELGCLGHLAIAAPLLEQPASAALELCEQAMALAREHGWTEDPVNAAGLGAGAVVLLWLGRFDEAERSLEQARRAVRPDGEPGTELVLHHATGLLAMARGRFDDAFAAFEAAERMQTLLVGEHVFSGERRSRIVQMQAWRGELAAARATLAEMAGEEHDLAGVRIAEAAVHLAEARRSGRSTSSCPVIECRERAVKASWAAIDASLLDALAREQLGDRGGAEASIERALDLAEPEGVLLPFVLFPVRELLERPSPAPHGARDAAHRDPRRARRRVGSGPGSGGAAARGAQRGRAARRPLPAEQPQGAGDRVRAVRLVEHGAHAPAPHLRQARRAQPHAKRWRAPASSGC